MPSLRDMGIERKMTLIIMLTTTLALLLACGAFLVYELGVFRTSMVRELESLAAIAGENTTAALSFADAAAAELTLATLDAQVHIVGTALYDAEGKLFATHHRKGGTSFRPPTAPGRGHAFTDDRLRLFHPIVLAGERAGTIYVESDLDEMEARVRRYAGIMLLVLAGASLLAFVLATRLQGAITRPLAHLSRVVSVVAAKQDYAVRASKEGDDELGRLIDGFNGMLEQIQGKDRALQEARDHLERRVEERTAELERVHKELLEASRRGGMAEIATNVLHNVGNVLNSVNVSASLVAEGIKRSKVADLPRLVALLREHEDDLPGFLARDPRGAHVLPFLAQLAEGAAAERRATVGELDSLRSNIEHIKEIVTMQQSYAKVSGVKERVDVVALVEDSLRMNVGALCRHGVELVREFEPVPPIELEKHKVLQILVNLVRNAKYACDESGKQDKRVTLRVSNGNDRVRVAVIDNGIGIPAENLDRIFNHGFTTRELGHGFGLHSGALAAQELGGSLRVKSAGLGQGATFTLELPVHPAGALQ